MADLMPMVRYLILAMEGRGRMSNRAIHRAVKQRFGSELPDHWESEVRQILHAFCCTQPGYNGSNNFFVHHGRGHWSSKVTSSALADL